MKETIGLFFKFDSLKNFTRFNLPEVAAIIGKVMAEKGVSLMLPDEKIFSQDALNSFKRAKGKDFSVIPHETFFNLCDKFIFVGEFMFLPGFLFRLCNIGSKARAVGVLDIFFSDMQRTIEKDCEHSRKVLCHCDPEKLCHLLLQ